MFGNCWETIDELPEFDVFVDAGVVRMQVDVEHQANRHTIVIKRNHPNPSAIETLEERFRERNKKRAGNKNVHVMNGAGVATITKRLCSTTASSV